MTRRLLYLLSTAAIGSLLVTGCSREREYEAHSSMSTALEQPHHERAESMTGHIQTLPPRGGSAPSLAGHESLLVSYEAGFS